MDDARDEQLVAFRLGEESYGVHIGAVREIVTLPPITHVPGAPSYVEGVINLRGQVVPVVDLRRRFGMPPAERGQETRVMVTEVGEFVVGLIVDGVSEVLTIAGANIDAPPAAVVGSEHSVRVDVALLDTLMNLVGELVTERNRLLRIGQELHDQQHAQSLGQVTAHLARVTQSLQENVLKARMLPVERLFRRFPRMVRDLARQLRKEIEFNQQGGDAELDRSVIEAISDPLVHVLRNAVDHGVEPLAEREAAGKPRRGCIELVARQEEGHVVVEVRDDGRGLDPARLRRIAVERGVCSAERTDELSDQDARELIFAPGFSTADAVSEVSGRGVGMDVVRRNVETVGGRVEIASRLGEGTTITLWLPLTLATVRSLLVDVGEATVALPLTSVAEGLRVASADVHAVGGRPVLLVRGRPVPLLSLARFLDQPAGLADRDTAVLVQVGRELYGLVVDHLIGEQEVVAKPLPAFWPETEGIGGVAILGDGRPALILDVPGVTRCLGLRSA